MKTIWLKSAAIFQIITGGIHSLSLFQRLQPQNETEKQLIDLMYNHRMEAGAGFTPSLGDLFLALSSCFTLMYLMGGLINLFLLRHKLSDSLWKGMILIQIIFFGIGFIMMYSFTFLPPIILTGLVFVLLLVSYFKTTTAA